MLQENDSTYVLRREIKDFSIPDDIKLLAALKGMTVEEYLKFVDESSKNAELSGVIVDGSNPLPFIAKVSRNPLEQAKVAAGKEKAKLEALKTVNGVLEATLPSTWINFGLKANGKEEMSDAASLAVDFAPAILGLGFSAAKRVAPRVFASKASRVSRPIFEGVPIEEGYMYHTTDGFKPHPIYPYRKGVDGKIRHYGEWTKGSLRKEDGKYVSVRPKHGDTDYIWWDTKGHNGGKEVYVTKLNDNATNVLLNLELLDISQYAGKYAPTYYVTEPIDINKTIKFTRDPISGSYIPSVPGKVVTNKMTIPELFSVASLEPLHNPKISLAFFERPSNISEAERLGIPKGLERTIVNNKNEILANAKIFALKYGYEIPETIDAAKAMYNLHNSFFRTPSNHEAVILSYDPELAKLPLELLYFKLASKDYPESMRSYDLSKNGIYTDDFVFVAPDYRGVVPYINDVPAVMLRRPFKKSNPLTWHKDAEWTIQSKDTPHSQVFGKNKIGTAQIGNSGPLNEFKISTQHLYPVKIAEPTDNGTLLGTYLGPYEYKSGGPIKIKNKNCGNLNYINLYK